MRILLIITIILMAIMAALFLRGRSLSLKEWILWGALIVLVPLLGPFLVIVLRPGSDRMKV